MVEVKLHDIGEGMTEGEILHYFVKSGDEVRLDEALVEVQTDKMVAELPSPVSGKVKEIKVEIGTTVQVGTTLLVIEADGERAAPADETVRQAPHPAEEAFAGAAETAATISKSHRVLAAPYTRKIAREQGVNIEAIVGTGPAGRVTDEDVRRFVAAGKSSEVKCNPQVVEQPKIVEKEENVEQATDVIPFKGTRKQIAKKMTYSLQTIPHVTHMEEIDMTNLLSLRRALKEEGITISAVAFFIKALVIALKDYPVFNAKLDEENDVIRLEKEYNIGLAVDTTLGLLVPVLPQAHKKSLREIHGEMKVLNEKAQNGTLSGSEMKGSTITISNVGPLGSIAATPIINHPETAIIAFHKTKKCAVVDDKDEIVVRSMMNISMSFDHRVADGATAVAFTNRFAELIENPNKLWLELV